MTTIGPVALGGIEELYYELDQMEDEARKGARDARRCAQRQQVEALEDQADHTESAAWARGAAQICTGVASMLGAAAQASALGEAGSATTDEAARAASKRGDIAEKAFDGIGEVESGLLTGVAGIQDAAGQRSNACATAAASRADDAKEVEGDARAAQDRLLRNLETAQQIQRDLAATILRA